ncbi:hypothetical protein [Natronococcus amylolyticus]|uniref:hypothetical protein n=1 Tax=Natronococcus amylolyticus TaxID=44470 RepID=UPI001268379B|nr:hypothetical protein [Natronococcus amylolyticus]
MATLTYIFSLSYIIVPVTMVTCVLLTLALYLYSNVREGIVIGALSFIVSTVSVYYHAIAYSTIGIDQSRFAYSVRSVVESGTTDYIHSGFYNDIPLFYLLPSMYNLISGGEYISPLVIYSAGAGLVPMFVYLFSSRLGLEAKQSIAAAGLGSLLPMYRYFAFEPNPNYHLFLITLVLVFSLSMFLNNDGQRSLLLVVLTMATIVYSHKFATIIISIVVFLIMITSILGEYGIIQSNSQGRRQRYGFWAILMALGGVLVLFQWIYVGDYLYSAFSRVFVQSESISVVPTAAESVSDPLIWHSHVIVLFGLSGIGWVYSLRTTDLSEEKALLLSYAAVAAFLYIVATVGGVLPQQRALLMSEPILAPLSIVAISLLNRKSIIAIIAISVVLSFSLAPIAIADNPNQHKYYLDKDEYMGQEFIISNSENPVYADRISTSKAMEIDIENDFNQFNNSLLSKEINDYSHGYIYLRSEQEEFLIRGSELDGSTWQLNYDLDSYLDNNKNKIYNNSGSEIHH